MLNTALIGYTGFVGRTLDIALKPDARFRSTNIQEIRNRSFGHIICAGVQAMKWWANLHPDEDLATIAPLLRALEHTKAERFTLISTIDVYPTPRKVDEDTLIEAKEHHAYGRHRLEVEIAVRAMFENVTILRLPGLFGPGLKKNVIFDLLHSNQLEKVHALGCFQYYDTRRLAGDISRVWEHGIDLLNISSEPITTTEIRDHYFPGKTLNEKGPPPPGYDMLSKYDSLWRGSNGYLYSKERTLYDLGDFLHNLHP